jgi:hypothetical protein
VTTQVKSSDDIPDDNRLMLTQMTMPCYNPYDNPDDNAKWKPGWQRQMKTRMTMPYDNLVTTQFTMLYDNPGDNLDDNPAEKTDAKYCR